MLGHTLTSWTRRSEGECRTQTSAERKERCAAACSEDTKDHPVPVLPSTREGEGNTLSQVGDLDKGLIVSVLPLKGNPVGPAVGHQRLGRSQPSLLSSLSSVTRSGSAVIRVNLGPPAVHPATA